MFYNFTNCLLYNNIIYSCSTVKIVYYLLGKNMFILHNINLLFYITYIIPVCFNFFCKLKHTSSTPKRVPITNSLSSLREINLHYAKDISWVQQ